MKLFSKTRPGNKALSNITDQPVCVTGDLHLGITSEKTIKALAEEILSKNPKAVILAGDLGEPIENFEKCISLFKIFKCPVGVLAGNHDIWNREKKNSSLELWEKLISKSVKKQGLVYLEEEDILLGSLAICGSMLWYDYSVFKDQLKNGYDLYLFEKKEKYNNDGNYIDWNKKDIPFAGELNEKLFKRMVSLEKNPEIKEIIVVSHVPVFPCQRVIEKGDVLTADAYFYNYTTGEELLKYNKLKSVVSGHTHRPVNCVVTKKNGSKLEVKVYPGDYRNPGYVLIW